MKQRFPFTSFPNGWFRIAYSHELPLEGVKPLSYFGKNLVLFRTKQGSPHVLDAYCPHLGANLGYGGRVEGETIKCPFHGWCFNKYGKCTDVPYANRSLPNVQIPTWHVREINGLIFLYYHAQGEAPTWELPQIPELTSREWTQLKQGSQCQINSHVQELHEQVVDIAHFPTVHSDHSTKSQGSEIDGSIWKQYLLSQQALKIATLNLQIETKIEIILYGLGYSLQRYCISGIGKLEFILLFLTTPVNEEELEIHMLISIKSLFSKTITSALTPLLVKTLENEVKKDFPIWKNKLYRTHPILCEGDGEIMRYRYWASQFYSELIEISRGSNTIL
ncbi:Rieske 2Fe-2S domain-containing protein [Nostoc sp. MG11]|uniref:Rieske 2Fe-2S domain-containing protein n=1 Tax=Nostoc sp. MG11 TaxID=2721166 RepID=UPI001868E8B2|nr:Rieske 2Fe-2S domain-containing protein [Nostoc sp. MG11]